MKETVAKYKKVYLFLLKHQEEIEEAVCERFYFIQEDDVDLDEIEYHCPEWLNVENFYMDPSIGLGNHTGYYTCLNTTYDKHLDFLIKIP